MARGPVVKARRGVIIATMVMLVIQIIGFFSTCIFYWFASSDGTRYYLSRAVFTALYHREDWPYLKRQQALEVNTITSYIFQLSQILFMDFFLNYLLWKF